MSDDDLPEVTARDAIQIAQRSLAKVNELERVIEELRADYDELSDEHTAMKLRLSEQDEERPYESFTLEEKVGMVREYAFEKAVDRGGRASFDYDNVVYEIFNGKPSADHAYKLMRLAAEARGFTYRENKRPKELAVDAREARRGAVFSSAKNSVSEGSAL